MWLSAEEFLRRFLLHVLPSRFVRIRHYGLLAGRNVDTKLAHCRKLLGETAQPPPEAPTPKTWAERADSEDLGRARRLRRPGPSALKSGPDKTHDTVRAAMPG
jgi:hypothetical protein